MKVLCWFSGLIIAVNLLGIGSPKAQSYPNKPIKLVVPYAAGSGSDILARTFAEPLSKALGQPIIVDNRPGNNSVLGTEVVATAAPDGYTLGLMTNAGLAASPAGLTGSVRYDPANDFSYITLVGSVTYVWLINNKIEATTAPNLIRLIKANPGKLNYASGNTGGIAYGGHLRNAHQLDVIHVPYKSTPPALSDLMAGHIQMMVADVAAARAMVEAGSVRAVGVMSAKRSPLLPDVPTFAESGLPTPPDMSGWWILVAPKGVQDQILERLNSELVRILDQEPGKSAILRAGITPMSSTRRQAADYQKEQLQIWKTMIKELDLKSE
jgi:tripartite-type tricarboxylate transporter receptor subunit TctC